MARGPRHGDDDKPSPPGEDPAFAGLTNPFLWPIMAAAGSANLLSALFGGFQRAPGEASARPPATWTTPHTIALELPTMRLREFTRDPSARATLICGPYALHGANVVDFAPGHSMVETLQQEGLARIHVTDWRSATAEMRHFSIDTYLADLNVAVDEISESGGSGDGPALVDLIGVCQGGWLALLYAARFPRKIGRLVIAGAPVDVSAAESAVSRLVNSLPDEAFAQIVRQGEGLVLGRHILEMWPSPVMSSDAAEILQLSPDLDDARARELVGRFDAWNAWTVDLPGAYYLQVVEWLFRGNRIAKGTFPALGHPVDLAAITHPLLLLAGRDDRIVAPEQLLAAARLVSSTPEIVVAPCGHLSLFMGRRTLTEIWPRIARFLAGEGEPRETFPRAADLGDDAAK